MSVVQSLEKAQLFIGLVVQVIQSEGWVYAVSKYASPEDDIRSIGRTVLRYYR